ncbi:MAG: hypothetical protein L0Y72_27135 [Gemmataceae bacterium]|nr:hypothetical protein [Gemmataceae bacterium]MCI0742726.1 hypothetical protein [Gemmataceae bacterium]
MRKLTFPCIVGVVCFLAVALQGTASDTDSIPVELKSFEFKVKEEHANLFGLNEDEPKLFFYTNGTAEAAVKVPTDGDYEVVIKASCDSAQGERAKFKVSIDGKALGKETLLTADEPKEYKLPAKLQSGPRKLAIAFTNDVYKENEFDRNLFVHAVTLKRAK